MRTKQTIIIIGAGEKKGADIAKALSKGNYRLLLNDKESTRLKNVLEDIKGVNASADVEVIDCSFNGCWEADIIILTVPAIEEEAVANKIKNVANQKVVISIANQSGEDQTGLTEAEVTSANILQRILAHSKVLKAIYTVKPMGSATGKMHGAKREMLVFGDDKEALDIIKEFSKTANIHLIETTQNFD